MVNGSTHASHCATQPIYMYATVTDNYAQNSDAHYHTYNKKLSYCWETVWRESMPRIAEMDVEMTT